MPSIWVQFKNRVGMLKSSRTKFGQSNIKNAILL